MDTISKFPGMTVQASDTESAFTQVKTVDAPRLLMLPEAECSEILIMIPPGQRTKSCDNIDNPVVPLEIPSDCSEKAKVVLVCLHVRYHGGRETSTISDRCGMSEEGNRPRSSNMNDKIKCPWEARKERQGESTISSVQNRDVQKDYDNGRN